MRLGVVELHKRGDTWHAEPLGQETASVRDEAPLPPFSALLLEAFHNDSQLQPLAGGAACSRILQAGEKDLEPLL